LDTDVAVAAGSEYGPSENEAIVAAVSSCLWASGGDAQKCDVTTVWIRERFWSQLIALLQ
jgi:hypothetical protein